MFLGINRRGWEMVAYIIAEIEVTDPEAYEEYKKLTPPPPGP